MYKQTETFFAATTETFHFLEHQYGYQRQEGFIESPNEPRDAHALVRYMDSRIGVEIYWYFVELAIGVAFTELLQPNVFPTKRAFFGDYPGRAKAINLYTLAEVLGHRDDPDFLLPPLDVGNDQKLNKRRAKLIEARWYDSRAKLIEARWYDILAGLARATQTYATSILKGDTTIFSEVMAYYTAQLKKRYPHNPTGSKREE